MKRVPVLLQAAGLIILCSCAINHRASPLTRLERSHYQQLTSSTEIVELLSTLSKQSSAARVVTMGTSVLGNPITGLLISRDLNRLSEQLSNPDRMTLLLIGSQHGSEPSGAEALLLIARDLACGDLQPLLDEANVIVIPNTNPDGRDRKQRVNGNGVNLSTNFVTATEPETRVLMDALSRWRPHSVLDVHESAALKKKSLGRQGFLIDFEAQFEGANNPNVAEEIRSFTYDRFLPELIDMVRAQGLPARRYIGEITDINQLITHGGLSLRNVRNLAGMQGIFSFLLENKLDPSTGSYSSPRNIKNRVAKQYLCIAAFLRCCIANRAEIMNICDQVRRRWQEPRDEKTLLLTYTYVQDEENPNISLPLKNRETGASVSHQFKYYGAVIANEALCLPAAYVVTARQAELRAVLEHHHIQYKTVSEHSAVTATAQRILRRRWITSETRQSYYRCTTEERTISYILEPGDLLVPLRQPARRIIPLLLDPRSMSSIFNAPAFASLVREEEDFFIYRIP